MAAAARYIPERLAEKLLQIRLALGLSQSELLRRLGLDDPAITQSSISSYELGTRVPPLLILLRYAGLANVFIDVLVDDGLDLPDKLPSRSKSEGVRRSRPARARRR